MRLRLDVVVVVKQDLQGKYLDFSTLVAKGKGRRKELPPLFSQHRPIKAIKNYKAQATQCLCFAQLLPRLPMIFPCLDVTTLPKSSRKIIYILTKANWDTKYTQRIGWKC